MNLLQHIEKSDVDFGCSAAKFTVLRVMTATGSPARKVRLEFPLAYRVFGHSHELVLTREWAHILDFSILAHGCFQYNHALQASISPGRVNRVDQLSCAFLS